MEQTAPAGALRISHDTYTQVRGIFEVQPQEPLTVKGVDEPIRSYLVLKAKPRSFRVATRGVEGVVTRMIGRDAELEQLQAAFKRLFTERKLAAVTVVAEAGLGKTRLLTEFETWAEYRPERFYVFRGRATPLTQGQPFGLLRDIVAWRFQIADDDTLQAAREKIGQGIIPLFEHDEPDLAEGHAHLLGHLIGIDWRDSPHVRGILQDPKQIRNRAFRAAAQMFRRFGASDGSPAVLELEDLHWADDESLDFLNYLAEVNRDVPLLIMALARPTLFERRTDWSSTEGRHQRIDLQALDKTGSRLLANELLKKLPEVPAALRELITSGSEGNPFYMEELVKMLVDQGAITTGETWSVNADRLLATKVPPTLTGVLQARLDSLPPAEKLTLQEASVIGQVFWDQALIALDERAKDALPALVQRELTFPRPDATLDGMREYVFKHAILHQVTYGTVLKRTKRELHGKLAHWLAAQGEQGGLRARDFLGITAEHFAQAGDEASAAEYYARAAEQAAGQFAHGVAVTNVGRAFELLDRLPQQPGHAHLRWRLLDARERTLDLQGERERQGEDLDAMEQLANTLDDDGKRAEVAWRRSIRAMRMSDFPAGERSARQAVRLATAAGNDEMKLESRRLLGAAMGEQGQIDAARSLLYETLAEARALGLKQAQCNCLNYLANNASMHADFVQAQALCEQALALARELGDRRLEALTLGNVGLWRLNLGDLAAGERDLEEGLRLARAIGDRALECARLLGLTWLALWQGEDSRALAIARKALEAAMAVQARKWEAFAWLGLGRADLALGRPEAANQAFERARDVAREINSPAQHDATAGLARSALAQGAGPRALQELKPLLDHVAAGGTLGGVDCPREVELTCHRVLAAAGDPRAAEWLKCAHANLQATAVTIGDPEMRRMFLTNIPEHREIVTLWKARQVESPGSEANEG